MIERSAWASTVVVVFVELLTLLESAVADVTEDVDVSRVASGVLAGTSTVSEKTATAPAGIDGFVHVIVPPLPIGGVVQLQPGGDENAANVDPTGTCWDSDPIEASLGPPFVTVVPRVNTPPAATGSGLSVTAIDRSATAFTVVVAAALLLAGTGSGEADDAITPLFSIVPPADGGTATVTEKNAELDGAIDGALHVIGPLPPIGGVEHDQPPDGAIETKVVPAGMVCVNVAIVAMLGPAFPTVIEYDRLPPAMTGSGASAIVELMSEDTVTAVHAESSDVAGVGVAVFVAVATMTDPGGVAGALTVNIALPAPSVITVNAPSKVCASPGLQAEFE